MRHASLLAAAAAAALAGGCIAVGGTGNYTYPTLGKQLQDLKIARDQGAISTPEYDDAKARLLKGDGPRARD